MDNFFNYITKPITPEDVDIWFRINNIIPEKMDLYYDFTFSLYYLVIETYFGHDDKTSETKSPEMKKRLAKLDRFLNFKELKI